MESHKSFSIKAGFVYLLFLTISISTTFCIRHKPLYFEEGIKQINGIDIYYKIIGEGLPLVFVHGGPGLEHTYFLLHMNKLARDYQLIYFDQRCSGRSGGNVDSALITIDPNNLTPELWEKFLRLQFRKNFYNITLLGFCRICSIIYLNIQLNPVLCS